MKKRNTSKRFLTVMLSMVMALGVTGTAWAGNVYGDDGGHIKIMTTAGESTTLPKTDFNGAHISLLPADAKIWVSSEGTTVNPDTIDFYVRVCPKQYITGVDSFTSANFAEEVYSTYPNNLEFDKQYSPFSEYYTNDCVYMAMFEDTEDGSWQRFVYMLDDGSYPVIPTETKAETESGWKQDSTGWWYQNADASYPKSTWQQIDGKYYYFNETGYMLADAVTPDGYTVDASGAWLVDVPKVESSQNNVEIPVSKDYVGEIPNHIYIPGYGYVDMSNAGGAVNSNPAGNTSWDDIIPGAQIGTMN